MDLAYLSDAFSQMSMRNTFYVGRYDYSSDSWGPGWSQAERELSVAEKHRQANRRRKEEQKKQSQPCPICQENKRRKLSSYIRQKSQEDASVIREEDEECAAHEGAQQHAADNSTKPEHKVRDQSRS